MITDISKGNKALEFIAKRIKDKKYRGDPSSEHNRYTMKKVVDILTLMDKYTPNQEMMTIRTTDISKRPKNTPEEFIYSKFCNEAKKQTEICTQDAMRKNLFVDLHRMGLIVRYDKNQNETDPFAKTPIKYVSLSQQGLKLIKAKTILDQYFIFSKAIDVLLHGSINTLLDILRDKEYELDSIDIHEYMFFVSAIKTDTKFCINIVDAVNLIKEYRTLTFVQRKSLIEILKKEMDPKNYSGSKLNKRDFGNWYNKIEQIYYLLNQTAYFECRGHKLILRGKEGIFEAIGNRLDRSLNEKHLYFKNHKIEKSIGFELHHVVPLSWAESVFHFKLLDVWENMVYIDAFNHAKITQNNNKNVKMDFVKNNVILSDFAKSEVYLEYSKNILYDLLHKGAMQKCNDDLLNTIK